MFSPWGIGKTADKSQNQTTTTGRKRSRTETFTPSPVPSKKPALRTPDSDNSSDLDVHSPSNLDLSIPKQDSEMAYNEASLLAKIQAPWFDAECRNSRVAIKI